MDAIQAAILGLVQGLGEFLPISSSGHLMLGRMVLGINIDQNSGAYHMLDILLHVGTLIPVLIPRGSPRRFWKKAVNGSAPRARAVPSRKGKSRGIRYRANRYNPAKAAAREIAFPVPGRMNAPSFQINKNVG